MPEVGGRSPNTTSTRTAAGGVCIIGGADEASQLQSLTERVTALEKALALLLGGDVEAGQLSDISQQVGWVHGITYMGTPGWTRTAAGTLIPPTGWSFFPKDGSGWVLSDGTVYHGISMDENGVIQFGIQADGTVSGEGLAGGNLLILSWSQNMTTFNEYLTFDTEEFRRGSTVSWSGTTINLPAGLILLSIQMELTWGDQTADNVWQLETEYIRGGDVFLTWPLPVDLSTNTTDTRMIMLYNDASRTLKLRYKSNDDVTAEGWIAITKL